MSQIKNDDNQEKSVVLSIDTYIDCIGEHKDVLSNCYRYLFKHNNVNFSSVSHAFFYAKAVMYTEMSYAFKIRDVCFGRAAMWLGKDIRVDSCWLKSRVGVMRSILKSKLEQCARYRKRLVHCTGLIVATSTYDDFWYTGLSKTETLGGCGWSGQNMLGQLHSEMREELKCRTEFKECEQAILLDQQMVANAVSERTDIHSMSAKRHDSVDSIEQKINHLLANARAQTDYISSRKLPQHSNQGKSDFIALKD